MSFLIEAIEEFLKIAKILEQTHQGQLAHQIELNEYLIVRTQENEQTINKLSQLYCELQDRVKKLEGK